MNIVQSQIFSALSNPIRLRCLYLLAVSGELCVCELVEALRIPQPSISKSLAGLKAAGLIQDRREANWTYYSLRADLPPWKNTIVRATVGELATNALCAADDKRIRQLAPDRRNLSCS
ncbi:MAG: metalloregulator ArsR/SmtB family transcription factor [Halioglobus sp.]